jgi:hypothetical protein
MELTPFELRCRRAVDRAVWVTAALTLACAGLVISSVAGIYGTAKDTQLAMLIGFGAMAVCGYLVVAKRYFER